MNLIIDIGNTRTKIAVFKETKIVDTFIFESNNLSVKEISNKINLTDFHQAIVSSVRKDHLTFCSSLKKHFKLIQLDGHTKIPLQNTYKTPESLGRDRIALAVGANQLFPTNNTLVIDAGTCITYDFIDEKNNYLGGAISPGLQIRLNALHTFTEKLPLVTIKNGSELIGKTTEMSILSGVINGATAEVDGIIDRYKEQFGNLKTVLTGGDANYFVKTLKNNIFANSKVLLNGLNTILNYNAK